MYQLRERVCSYCLPVCQSHTHAYGRTTRAPSVTLVPCVTRSGCEADTCSDMMVSVEVVTLAVCRLPRCELSDLGEERWGGGLRTEQNRSLLRVRGDFVVTCGVKGSTLSLKWDEVRRGCVRTEKGHILVC